MTQGCAGSQIDQEADGDCSGDAVVGGALISGITVPDSKLANEITEFIRDRIDFAVQSL
jgi:hypothetical protein